MCCGVFKAVFVRNSYVTDHSQMSYLLSCFARIRLRPHRPPAGFGMGWPRSFNFSFLSEAVRESRRTSAVCRRSRSLPSALTRDRVRRPSRQRRLWCWWPPRTRSLRQSVFFIFEWPRPRVLCARSSFPVVLRLVLARGPLARGPLAWRPVGMAAGCPCVSPETCGVWSVSSRRLAGAGLAQVFL